MGFHFTLSGLLRLRESLEKAELQRLQAIAAAVAAAQAEIDSLEKTMNAARRRVSDSVAATGMTGAELQFEGAREAACNALRSQWLNRLAELTQKRKEQYVRFVQARMQREIVSNLRTRQLAEYQVEQSRRSQQRVDELFLTRRIPAVRKAKSDVDDSMH